MIREYLFANDYKIAQVTMDFSDYLWNTSYARCLKKGDEQSLAWLKKSYIENAIKDSRGFLATQYDDCGILSRLKSGVDSRSVLF